MLRLHYFICLENVFAQRDGFGYPLKFVLGHGVVYYCWSVIFVTVLKRAWEGVVLDASTVTVMCPFGIYPPVNEVSGCSELDFFVHVVSSPRPYLSGDP